MESTQGREGGEEDFQNIEEKHKLEAPTYFTRMRHLQGHTPDILRGVFCGEGNRNVRMRVGNTVRRVLVDPWFY